MSIVKLCRTGYCRFLTKLRYASSVATSSSSDLEVETLKKTEPKVSRDVTGISVVSVENYSPITHIAVLVKAGSRYEDETNLGIVHCLRNCAVLSSKNHTSFALTRHVEQRGAKIGVTSTREYVIYSLQCIRDDIESTVPVLGEIVAEQAFKPWEVKDALPRMNVDLAILKNNPEARLMEALHKVAFRGGLNNSVYSPEFMIGKHDSDMLLEYVHKHYASENAVVAGLGINHEHLDNLVAKFVNLKIEKVLKPPPARFSAGEIRIEEDLPFTRTAIVAEGASMANTKEMLSLGVLQCILGVGPQTKYSCGEHSKLGSAAAKSTIHPFSVSSVNVNYSDTGMFGVYIAGHPHDMKEIVKSVVSKMRESTKGISDEEVKSGKHALKAKLFLGLQTAEDQVEDMAVHCAISNQLRSTQELEAAIDSLTSSDISAMANKVMKTKPAMASIGPLHHTPYLDELI